MLIRVFAKILMDEKEKMKRVIVRERWLVHVTSCDVVASQRIVLVTENDSHRFTELTNDRLYDVELVCRRGVKNVCIAD